MMMSQRIRKSFRAYEPVPHDAAITLALDRTEPPLPYRQDVGSFLPSTNSWSRYPSTRALEAKLAARWEVNPENVIVTAGADEALDRACRMALVQNDDLLTTTPTFEMIGTYASLAGANLLEVPWLEGEFPTDDFTSRISSRTRLIILVCPNNPTGQTIPAGTIEQIAGEYPSILLVLDLAYVEFSSSDPTRELLRFPNILVVRSFSKAWGLPGLRLGYVLGSSDVIQALHRAGGPYSVASSSTEIVTRQFERFEGEMHAYVERIKEERKLLEAWLDECGEKFIASRSNFVLLFPRYPQFFDAALRNRGMHTRSFEQPISIHHARRLTLPGNIRAFEQLWLALTEAFQFQGAVA